MADVSKGDKFVAGGVLKEFTVESVKDGDATLKETDRVLAGRDLTGEGDGSPEEIIVPVRTLIDGDSWKGIEES